LAEDRYGRDAMLITSQIPVGRWHDLITGNPILADAILERLVHNAHRIQQGLRFVVGAGLVLQDGAEYVTWSTSRAGSSRLTRLLLLRRIKAPKGECHLSREQMPLSAV
jgi:hypothetical protein